MTEDETWTGVTLQYVCPNCGKQGQQVFVIDGVGWDEKKAAPAAWKERSPCKSCNEPLPDRLNIGVDICAGSLEQLRKAGYPTPPVN